jgi:hypothetical protein
VQQAKLFETGERRGDGPTAYAGPGGNRVIRRVEPAGVEIEKIEQQRIEDGECGAPDPPAVLALGVRLPVEGVHLLPMLCGLLTRHRDESDFFGRAVAPDRPRGIGLRRSKAGQGGKSIGKRTHRGSLRVAENPPEGAGNRRKPSR